MLKHAIEKLINGDNLSETEMYDCMMEIMNGEATDAQIACFLTSLKIKGEAIDEIVAGAKVLREKAEHVDLDDYYTIDTCGTGGDKLGTYNISTAAAIICAAAGIKVVKHGNRSVSSNCGSADVLEELGIKIALSAKEVEKCVKQIGIGFFFAPNFHKAMGSVAKTRRELGFRTIFNILGPLANPANAKAQVLGVFDYNLVKPMANVLKNLGIKRALVVHGMEGLDEISISGDTYVCELKDNEIIEYTINPLDFGIKKASIDEIVGSDKIENAQIIRNIFVGEKGAKRDVLLLNSAAAIYIGNKADSIKEGVELAKSIIDDGLATKKLDEFIKLSNSF